MNARYAVPILTAAALLALPARSCGPDFPDAIFVIKTGPGGSYAAYAKGRIGVPQQEYRTRHLVIAYNWLTQRPLTVSEQKQAVAVDQRFANGWEYEQEENKNAPPSGLSTWITARSAIGAIDGYLPDAKLETNHLVAGEDYDSFENCLDDAFANAARTFAARAQTYGAKSPAVLEWVRGQDAVFTNCGDGKPERYFGPGPVPPPPPTPHPPAALPANAPTWLKQDRAYQLAAANFYAMHYDDAITQFRAITADTASPWSPVARYLVARALIRKATLEDDQLSGYHSDPSKQAAAKAQLISGLGMAHQELIAMRSEPGMASMRTAIDNLLDYVDLRYQPDQQAVILASRLHKPGSGNFGQSLIDLTYLRTDPPDATTPPPPHRPERDPTGMIDWIDVVSSGNQHLALQHWHTTHTTAWLVAAISFTQPADAATPELVQAAQAVPASDPAYVSVTYHRLRLTSGDPSTRKELLTLLPSIERTETRSTINLFSTLNAASASTLESWLTTAGRSPAGETSWGDIVDYSNLTPAEAADSVGDEAALPAAAAHTDVCGTKIKPNSTKLFDIDAANALNRDIPLRILAKAAESSALPANLQFQIAQATWARAVLLDQPATARRMTPILIHCRPAWQPVLDTYNASTTPADRQANGLLALMRFASTEPSVRYGEERREGFATYDNFRQNWWCTTVPPPGQDVDYSADSDYHPPAVPAPPAPLFLNPTDLAEAHTEIAALTKIPNASTYFAKAALAWMKLHPQDPRTPDLLGEADRVVRNSCRTEVAEDPKTGKPTGNPNDPNLTPNLAHEVFLALHTHYPQSPWTRRYTSWE